MKVGIILGTRPEIIKMAPIIGELRRKKIHHFIIHSGQHYSYNLDKVFFEQLSLPKPHYKLEVGSASSGEQTALIISRAEKILKKNRPDIVLVQGDTNTVLGGAIAAKKLHIPVGHVEAGLRSYDESMPEELNRRLTDHCSDFLFVPTKKAQSILLGEGIPKKKIFLTGNTIVDSVKHNLKEITNFDKLNLIPKEFFLVSLHRQENVDNPKRFKSIVEGLKKIKKEYNMPIIFPIHPRSKKMAKKLKVDFKEINVIEPVNYLQFLHLQKNSRLVLTDSGGVQEESCILKIPCVTLRDNTERPETLKVGSNLLAGSNPDNILLCTKKMLRQKRNWKNPFGDGKSAAKIVKIIQDSVRCE
ncbi:non-hydrolyzing UDP-N-acetylglucosamine 2-epimerase [Candidatus Nitrosopumilus sediminis]|uniref:UDP-N-acetylglucosamine 2-epimerase n=1 Tax=Candidatus Nitrosopumilus sediminis TaxID=1229909 RepID=K0BEN5_9ARCH|nr:UDP-N-acetylglucosamine 2-epimerase (non-hydrolyzing) [Candidatus Nitrosopumilus sediminis]AFS83510.1 UDP-N-acetylglucosamine 2-epimerase [Candidatus Nitrosopumilus sediminis]